MLPTGVVGLGDVPREEGKGFIQLPCFGSRSVVAGWYSAMDDGLNALESAVGDKAQKGETVLRLYEAFLSLPMRLRLSPSHAQICLDSISYGEDLHSAPKTQREKGRPNHSVQAKETQGPGQPCHIEGGPCRCSTTGTCDYEQEPGAPWCLFCRPGQRDRYGRCCCPCRSCDPFYRHR